MNKSEFISAVAKSMHDNGLVSTEASVSRHLGAILETIKEELKTDKGNVSLVGFGTFSTTDVPERTYRNPQTGEPIVKPATTVAKCKLSKTILD